MTAITFPNSPSSGDTHTAGNGIVYTYDGEKWTSIGTNSAGTWSRSGTEVSLTNAGDDLNVDSGTLFVDASTDRVGVGTTSPAVPLHVDSASTGFRVQREAETFSINAKYGGQALCAFEFTGSMGFFPGGSTEKIRIDSDGRLLVGTSTAVKNADRLSGNTFALAGTGANYPSTVITSYATANADAGPLIEMQKSRGETDGSMTVVSNDDRLGTLQFLGSDGTNFIRGAAIAGYVDGTPGTNDMPGRLVFSTTADGASSPTERMRIESDGDFILGGTTNYALIRPWDTTTGNLIIGADQSSTGTGGSATIFRNRGAERMRIDSSGRLLVTAGANPAFTGINAKIYSRAAGSLIVSEGNASGYTEGAFLCVSPNSSRGGGIYMFNSNGGGTNNEWFAGRPYSSSDRYIISRASSVGTPGGSTAQIANELFALYSTGNVTIQGTLTQSGSDDRLKENRTPLTSALAKVESLEGFTYNWNQDAIDNYGFSADDGTLVGMSAQELQLVLPEAVKTVTHETSIDDPTSGEAGEVDTYLTIQYERVVPLLVEAIKELSAQKSSLEARVAALEAG